MTTQELKKTKKEYNDLGQMVSAQDFEALFEKLKQYEGTVDMEILTDTKGKPFSELDELLYHIPRLAVKKLPKMEKSEKEFFESLDIVNDSRAELCPYLLEVVDVILKNGGNPNTPIKNGITAFMMACTVNNEELIKKLIENKYSFENIKTGDRDNYKADLNKGDGRGNRPLYYATMTQSTFIMESLVKEYGVDPDFQYFLSDNKTVFHYICQNFAEKIVVDSDGLTFKQSENENKEKGINKLIELGANPHILDDFENLPEMLIPSFDPEIHSEEDISKEELKIWDEAYEKVGNYRKNFQNTPKQKNRVIF